MAPSDPADVKINNSSIFEYEALALGKEVD